jgi:hypothetical protein
MDASRFDAWTRRRFGLALGRGTASLLGLAVFGATAAKKHKHKHKKKRCKKSLQSCVGKKKCCKGLTCEAGPNHCCKPVQGTCTAPTDCCGDQCCTTVDGLSGTHCCGGLTAPCTEKADCCGNLICAETLFCSPPF